MKRISIFLSTLFTLGVFLVPSMVFAGTAAVRCVQGELNDLGYKAGITDGDLGNQTKRAASNYINYMKKTYEGWNMPKLSKKNADFWCKQVASANPSVGDRYQTFLKEIGSSGISVEEIKVDRVLKAKVPYKVTISYTVQGDTPVKINQACFTWSGEGPYCFPVKLDTKKQEASLMLHTGRPDTYSLNGALRYTSEGKTSMSNWYTNEIVVHR